MKKTNLSLPALILLAALVSITISNGATAQSKQSASHLDSKATAQSLAPTPPMGWNSWNHYHQEINEKLIMAQADAMVSSGMKAAGYEYINLDDCWMALERDADGNLQADPVRFPHGIKYLADYMHKRGLKIGLYSSAGTKTCAGWPASLDHEEADAKMFAKWEIDFLKYDNCNNEGRPIIERYTKMKKALDATGRPIVFSICEWGSSRPWEWAPSLGELWRTTGDINDSWPSVVQKLDQQVDLGKYSRKGGWNDPDMLEVGNHGMTNTEYRAHFSLWCIMAAPLIAGNDMRKMSDTTLNILTNKEAIAIDQDPAGNGGYKLRDEGDREVWVKELADGSYAVALLNRGTERIYITMQIEDLGIKKSAAYTVRNVWNHNQEIRKDGMVRSFVDGHGVEMYRVTATTKEATYLPVN